MTVVVPSEHLEQVFFVAWFRRSFPGVRIFAIPNGGGRSCIESQRFKAEGVCSGVPDLYVPAWRLWIEMKRTKGGTLSAEQRDWLDYLSAIGDTAYVCHGREEAMLAVNSYLEKRREKERQS